MRDHARPGRVLFIPERVGGGLRVSHYQKSLCLIRGMLVVNFVKWVSSAPDSQKQARTHGARSPWDLKTIRF